MISQRQMLVEELADGVAPAADVGAAYQKIVAFLEGRRALAVNVGGGRQNYLASIRKCGLEDVFGTLVVDLQGGESVSVAGDLPGGQVEYNRNIG